MGCIQFDVIKTIKSLATPKRRATQKAPLKMGPDSQETRATHCYADEWLQKLDGEWVKISHLVKTQMLVPILLTQTLSILIDGNPIIEDFMVKMKEKVDADIAYDNAFVLETQKRVFLLDEHEAAGASKIIRYTYARWTAYLSQADWKYPGWEDSSWWDEFTIEHAREVARRRRLIGVEQARREEEDYCHCHRGLSPAVHGTRNSPSTPR